MKIGKIDIASVMDGQLICAAPHGFPHRDDPAFKEQNIKLAPDGRWIMDVGAFVIRTGDRVMLCDAGCGPGDMCRCAPPPFDGMDTADPVLLAYYRSAGLEGETLERAMTTISQIELHHGMLGDNLAKLGIKPEEITDVILTHLHFDHIGWVSHEGKPCFPNATYRCERQDAAYFLGEQPIDESLYKRAFNARTVREVMTPVFDRLELWDGDSPIAPGVDAVFAPGHTPGSSLMLLSSEGERAMLLGDTVHCPLELTDPEFTIMSDMDPALADRTRARIAREIEGGDIQVNAPHFPDLKFGRMIPGHGKKNWLFGETV